VCEQIYLGNHVYKSLERYFEKELHRDALQTCYRDSDFRKYKEIMV
jgi:hypothetical protein